MGAAEMVVWARLDGAVCDYRPDVWDRVVQSFHQANLVESGTSFCAQSGFQLRLYAHSVWFEKQSSRRDRHPVGPRDADVGVVCDLARRTQTPLDRVREYSVSPLGRLRHRFTTYYYVFELVTRLKDRTIEFFKHLKGKKNIDKNI